MDSMGMKVYLLEEIYSYKNQSDINEVAMMSPVTLNVFMSERLLVKEMGKMRRSMAASEDTWV